MVSNWRKEYCGLGAWRPQFLQPFANIRCFTVFAALITAVQGIYLGYMIGTLTTIEKRFEIPSAWSGGLLSVYDFGHALTVLLVGHYGSIIHQPKWIAAGATLSSFSCFGLLLPHVIFGGHQKAPIQNGENFTGLTAKELYPVCSANNYSSINATGDEEPCSLTLGADSNQIAYFIFAAFQLLAGIASSPFTTLSYVYIDDNATRKQSPFYMGIVTAMWAYGPALGFGLSSYTTQLWLHLGSPPNGVTTDSPEWIGAWWLGMAVLCVLYLLFGLPFLFYPRTLRRQKLVSPLDSTAGDVELVLLHENGKPNAVATSGGKRNYKWSLSQIASIPCDFIKLLRNPMVSSLSLSWIAGAYLFGGYSTFLPKYLEVVFFKATFVANILGGIVAVVGVATSTAIGGKVLSWLNPKASKALFLVFLTFLHSLITFIALMFVACDNPLVNGLTPDEIKSSIASNNFSSPVCSTKDVTDDQCACDPLKFYPVCDTDSNQVYFSPCYLGCKSSISGNTANFANCDCALDSNAIEAGYCNQPCSSKLTLYLIASFFGGAVGAFFQMALFTNIIWAVPKEKKANVVALSNFLMSVFGFLPSQVVYGKIFDSTCAVWSVGSDSTCESGYCLLYNNRSLRFRYHATTAAFQLAAMLSVLMGYFVSRKYQFPKRDEDEEGNMENLNNTLLADE